MVDVPSLRDAYFQTIRAGDRRQAFDIIDGAAANGADIASLYLDVLQPALREVGRLWQTNEMTVADEHLATAITQMIMARLYTRFADAAGQRQRSVVAACAETERHEVGLRMVCDLLERDGWDAVYLGASVPTDALVQLLRDRPPHVLILSATIPPHLPQLRETIRIVRAAGPQPAPHILVGGRAFHDDPTLASRVGADGTANDAREAVERLNRIFP